MYIFTETEQGTPDTDNFLQEVQLAVLRGEDVQGWLDEVISTIEELRDECAYMTQAEKEVHLVLVSLAEQNKNNVDVVYKFNKNTKLHDAFTQLEFGSDNIGYFFDNLESIFGRHVVDNISLTVTDGNGWFQSYEYNQDTTIEEMLGHVNSSSNDDESDEEPSFNDNFEKFTKLFDDSIAGCEDSIERYMVVRKFKEYIEANK